MWIYLITLLLWQMFSPLMLLVSVFGLVLALVALQPPAAAHNFLKKMVASTGIKFLQSDGAMEKARIYLVLFLLVLLLVPLGGLYSTLLAWFLPLLLLVAHASTRQVPAGVEQVRLRFKSAPTLGNWLTTMGGGPAPGTTGSGGPAKVTASHAGPGQGVGGGTVNAPGFGGTQAASGGADLSRGGADAEGAFVGDGGSQAEAGVAPGGPTPGFGGPPAVPLGGNPEDGLRARGNSQH